MERNNFYIGQFYNWLEKYKNKFTDLYENKNDNNIKSLLNNIINGLNSRFDKYLTSCKIDLLLSFFFDPTLNCKLSQKEKNEIILYFHTQNADCEIYEENQYQEDETNYVCMNTSSRAEEYKDVLDMSSETPIRPCRTDIELELNEFF